MKKTLAIVGIGAAFLAVSLWVWLSQGRNAKAVRAKFRLGGALLTLTGLMTLGSCTPGTTCYEPIVDCYDPAPVNEIFLPAYVYDAPIEVANGQELLIEAYAITFDRLKFSILTPESEVLQEQLFEMESPTTQLTLIIDVEEYVGAAKLVVKGLSDGLDYENILREIALNITDGTEE